MTISEAKDTKRWWLQNSYKHKGEMPQNVVEALRILDGGSTTASAAIKVLNTPPPVSQAAPPPTGGLAEWVAEVEAKASKHPEPAGPQSIEQQLKVIDDKLAALIVEYKTASPDRLKQIEKEQGRLYNKRYTLKKKAAKRTPDARKPSEMPETIHGAPVASAPKLTPANDPVSHPAHYTDGKIEVIDFIEDKNLCFCLGNAVKYIARAGKKDPAKTVDDLKKAQWYLVRKIQQLEASQPSA